MTVEEKIKQLTDANKELKRLVSEQNLRIQDWIAETRRAQEYGKMEYERGIAYAWEGARKVIKLKVSERLALFDGMTYETIMEKDPSEVMQKLKDREEKKKAEESKINVGDEVISIDRKSVGVFYEPFVVTGISRGEVTGVGAKYTHTMLEKDVRKTGRHFPEIATVMERLIEEGKEER